MQDLFHILWYTFDVMNENLLKELKQYIERRFVPPIPEAFSAAPNMASSAVPASGSAPKASNKNKLFSLGESPLFRPKKADAAEKAAEEAAMEAMEVYAESTADYFSSFDEAAEELKKRLKYLDESFADMLLRKIDESGMTDAECYHKAQLTRGHFNKIKNLKGYRAGKSTVLALVLALGLEKEEASEMLAKAGYAFSPSSKRDLIVEFCIEKGIYDITQVNEYLFAFDQELLGAQ